MYGDMRVYMGANSFRVFKPITIMSESMAHLHNHREGHSPVSQDSCLKFKLLSSHCQRATAFSHLFFSEDLH